MKAKQAQIQIATGFALLLVLMLAGALFASAETSIVLNPGTVYIDIYGTLNMSGSKIINLGTPTADTDAATKKYVDDELSQSGGAASGWEISGNTVQLITSTDNVSANTLFVDNTNSKVGIGTVKPSHTLTVKGTFNASVNLSSPKICLNGDCKTSWPVVDGGSSGSGWTNTSDLVSLSTSTDDVNMTTLYVNNTGNWVGFGTSTPAYLLQVYGGNASFGQYAYFGDANTYFNPSGQLVLGQNDWIGIGGAAERIVFDGSNDHIKLLGANVGIGASSPAALLHVDGGGMNINNTLYVNETTNRVGVGIANPSTLLEVSNTTQGITLDPEATTPTINTTGGKNLIITSAGGNVIIQIG
jgi:phage tail tube protein FII